MFGITDVDSLLTGAGLVSSRVYSGIGLIVVLAFAIGIGKAALAGEEKSRTADLLLATPPTRERVVVDKATAMVALLLGLMAGVALIVWLGDLAVGLDLGAEGLAAANLGMAALAFLFGSVALAVGAATGKPGLAIGVAAGLGVALFLLNGFGAIIDWLEPFRVLSPFYWYQGDTNPLDQRLGWQQPLLFAVGVVLVGATVFLFRRRDIGT
jgi:ABC-2 type transport system permease protein